MHPHSIRPRTALLLAALLAAPPLHAQQDAPPVDVGQLLQALRTLREQQTVQVKTQKQNALQQISAVANSPERAILFWEEAIRTTQFDGMTKEGAQFRAWKEGEGEALKERAVANAVHLHLTWLALTLQRSSGAEVKDLLPAIVNYTKELSVDEAMMDALSDEMKKEREAAAIAPPGGGNRRNQQPQRRSSDAEIKRAHDNILKRNLGASPVVKWMNLNEAINVAKWENNPSDFDGIYEKIILPELRAQRDVRALEYWDIKLKKEADAATRSKLAYEVEKFNTQRRPTLLWSRAEELAQLGQKNRAVGEMFNLIKTYPAHPSAGNWITTLEQTLMPPAPAAGAASAAVPPAN